MSCALVRLSTQQFTHLNEELLHVGGSHGARMAGTSGASVRGRGVQYSGCIASEELGAVGAGIEGWLDNPAVVVAMTQDHVALACRQAMVIETGWKHPEDPQPPVLLHVECVEVAERVTSLEWVVFQNCVAAAVGTSHGALLLYSHRGTLLLKQVFPYGPILRVRSRGSGNMCNDTSEDLCLLFPKTILRVDVYDLRLMVRRRLLETDEANGEWAVGERSSDEFNKLQYQMWKVSAGSSNCVDGAITGVIAPPLMELEHGKRHFCAAVVGADCTVAAYRVSEDKGGSLAGALLSKGVTATVSTISSLSKVLWRSDPPADSRPVEVKPQAFARASVMTSFKDAPRKGESIAISPSGNLAAVTDSLGRVLLIDVQALVVIRLWKGYRDANCHFLEAPFAGTAALSSYGDLRPEQASSVRKHDFFLCLAIHAPRRGVVEVWKLRYGSRISVVRCGESSRLLQPSCKFRSSSANDTEHGYLPAQVYIFNGQSGQLSLLNPFTTTSDKLFCLANCQVSNTH